MLKNLLGLVLFFAFSAAASACNIPVFRYALERWRPDPCEISIFYSGSLSPSEKDSLRKSLPDRVDGFPPSVSDPSRDSLGRLTLHDIHGLDGEQRALWDQLNQHETVSVPHVLVRGSVGPSKEFVLWKGPLSGLQNAHLFSSPSRAEISRRLLAGHSIVWLMVTGKDEGKTAAVRSKLKAQLPKLQTQIQLPEGIGLPGSELFSDVPLLVKFSHLEIDYRDAKESFLIELFSDIRPLEVSSGESLVIPIFGRGRALEVIPGKDLTPELMTDLTLFLSGACSCQVKDQNPGFDLLMNKNWTEELFPDGDQPPPSTSIKQGAGGRRTGRPELLDIPSGR